MTEAADPQNPSPEAPRSLIEPTAPDAPPTPPAPPEPAPEPVKPPPEGAGGDLELLDFDSIDPGLNSGDFDAVEAIGTDELPVDDHPSKQPVASRPAPAGPPSDPHPRVAQARDENR